MKTLRKTSRLISHMARIALFNPRRLSHVLGTALSVADDVVESSRDLLRIPSVTVNDLLPEDKEIDVRLAVFPKTYASVSVLEYLCLVLLLRKTCCRSVFEFGTYQGVSISELALNMPEGSQICTLDLPEEGMEECLALLDPEDRVIAAEKQKGTLVPASLRKRIHFLKQDSAKFDETPFVGKMDFVFVDGAHDAAFVRNDSEKGWRMLAKGGIIAWHDCCSQDPAVVRYLINSQFNPKRIEQTSLAFAVKG